jgi:hypothetical protein
LDVESGSEVVPKGKTEFGAGLCEAEESVSAIPTGVTARPAADLALMTAQEVLKAGIEKEVQEDIARVTQHHDESHQGADGAIDRDPSERPTG